MTSQSASSVDIATAGRFMETAAEAGFSADHIAIFANNPQVMKAFYDWIIKHPVRLSKIKEYRPKREEIKRCLRVSAEEIFTQEAIAKHGGAFTDIRSKVSLLMSRGAPLIEGVEWLDFDYSTQQDVCYRQVRYLCVLTRDQARIYPKIGEKAVGIISKILEEKGLHLGMDPLLCK